MSTWSAKRMFALWPLLWVAHIALASSFFFYPTLYFSLFDRSAIVPVASNMGVVLGWFYVALVYFTHTQFNKILIGKLSFLFLVLIMTASLLTFIYFILRFEYSRVLFMSWIGLSTLTLSAHVQLLRRAFKAKHYCCLDSQASAIASQLKHSATLFDKALLNDAERARIALKKISGLVYAQRDQLTPEIVAFALLNGLPVINAHHLRAKAMGRVPVAQIKEFSKHINPSRAFYLKIKRGLELSLCLVLMPLFLLFLALGMAVVLISSGRPLFYRQPRIGMGGREFIAYKLRTMHVDADKDGVTQDQDQRIIAGGKLLRALRIDEIPQIYNILLGQMSLIGPRAEWTELVEKYRQLCPSYDVRHAIRPGITGWAQVSQGHTNSTEQINEKLERDVYYILFASADLDLLIILRTIWTILARFGAR